MRLGQAHCSRPDASCHFREIQAFELFRSVRLDSCKSAVREAGIGPKRKIRRADELLHREAQRMRQPLAAIVWGTTQSLPPRFGISVISFLKARRGAHGTVLVSAALGVA